MTARRRVPEKEPGVQPLSSGGASAADTANPAAPAAPAARLLHWDELPAWRRDNAFIHGGYRPTSNSYVASLASVAAVHNESVNIWTHLGGALVALALGASLYVERGPIVADLARFVPGGLESSRLLAGLAEAVEAAAAVPSSSTLVLSCFAAGAVACLGMSATYHALTNHSPAVARWGNKLDYSGIVFLIVGSYVPTLYYGFFCHPRWLTVYMYLIILLGLACLAVSWLDHFRTPQWRPYRALLFVCLGASGVVPIAHGLFLLDDGYSDGDGDTLAARYRRLDARIGLSWVLLQGGLYIFGAFLYAVRWPERRWPGRFDIWGSSHQIFHVFVLLAAAAHLRGVVQSYTFHHNIMGGLCPVPPLP